MERVDAIDYPLWKNIGNLFPELMYLPDQMEKNLKELEKVIQEL